MGSLLAALGLTAMGDTYAQTQRTDPRKHARLTPDHDATELRVLDWTLWNVSKYYVEPDRIDPQAMTLAALEALEQDIAEVLVEPRDGGKKVLVRVGTAERVFDISDVEALWAVGPHVREVFRFVNKNTDLDEDEQRNAEYAVVGGVLSTLDPHTTLLRPEDFEDMRTSTKGSFGGLGIEVGMRDGAITVIRVIEDNPASKVDMRPGDRIVQIDAESTVTMSLNDAVGRLRGPADSVVAVYVMRDGLQKPKRLDITRATIQLDSVIGDVLISTDDQGKGHKVGLVQIPRNFSQNTGQELRDKLVEFERQGVEGVVLDLRGNPGGLLNAAVDVADAFLSSGTIVATVGVASPRKETRADDRFDFPNLPLVVLVDQGSASASEIVAGALRNQGRAVLLGRRSFGKGSVQELRDRKVADKELALKLTVAQYLTPGDVSIQSVGVAPDVETIPVWIAKEYVAYFGRERFDLLREESLSDHLESDKAEELRRSPFTLHFLEQGSLDPAHPGATTDEEALAERRSAAAPVREADKDPDADKRTAMLLEDPEVRMARDLVLWAPSSNRDELLGRMKEFVSQQQEIEQHRIVGSLAARNIDWSAGPKPSGGTAKLKLSLSCDKAGNTIKGGEKGTVKATVTNVGDAPAYQVRAITDSDYRYFDERELMFGRIDPGASKSFDIELSVGENELSRTDRIDLHLFEQHGAKLAAGSQSSIDISAEGLSRPQFAFGYQVLDMPRKGTTIDGNGDGAWQVGERVTLRVHVSNKGEGPALDTWVSLRNLSDDAVFIHEGRERIKKLDVGQTRVIDLDVELRAAPPGSEARVQLSVSDTKVGEALAEKLVFPVLEGVGWIESDDRVVITRDVVDLYASPLQPDRVIARAPAGERFKADGRTGSWVRVELGDGGFAFARREQVEDDRGTGGAKGKVKRPGKHDPVLEVSPPKITLQGAITQTDGTELRLDGSITDESRVQDVFITVANPSRDLFAKREKVFYEASTTPGSGTLDFGASVPLTPGNNLIEVYARENDDVVATKRMWVLRTSGLAEARAKEAEFASNGKLAVDTLK
ncbi:S41 family peptidase [Paraliomyxa miuraensis]|nr:S41 family peptidase [Paraliomyxa miuraensis]